MKKLSNGVIHKYPEEQGVALDPEAFDTLIRSQGTPLVHFRAMKCPIGMKDRDDSRRSCEDHKNCSNGHIYTMVGVVTCSFTSNGQAIKFEDFGAMDDSRVTVSVPRFYDGTTIRVRATSMDRFYINTDPKIMIEHQQYAERTQTGRDKLSYPIDEVISLVDSLDRWYTTADFDLVDGRLCWKPGKGPGIDPDTGRGTVYSIRYLFTPFFYVERVLHQIRVAQVEDIVKRYVTQMPQQLLLAREFVFESEKNDPDAVVQDSPRQSPPPRFGAPGTKYQLINPAKGDFRP